MQHRQHEIHFVRVVHVVQRRYFEAIDGLVAELLVHRVNHVEVLSLERRQEVAHRQRNVEHEQLLNVVRLVRQNILQNSLRIFASVQFPQHNNEGDR